MSAASNASSHSIMEEESHSSSLIASTKDNDTENTAKDLSSLSSDVQTGLLSLKPPKSYHASFVCKEPHMFRAVYKLVRAPQLLL